MSRTVRARKNNNYKKKWWIYRHFTFFDRTGEIVDNSYLWRADKTRKPTTWSDRMIRDGQLSKSYRAYEQHYGRQCFRADEKAMLAKWESYEDEDVLFPVHKSHRRCKTFWWWWD